MGERLRQELKVFASDHFQIEGQAACCVLEFARSPDAFEQASQKARQFTLACVGQQLRIHLSGLNGTRVVMLPPLNMTDDELFEAIQRIRRAVFDMAPSHLPSRLREGRTS